MSMKAGDRLEPLIVESVDDGRMKTMAMLLRDPNPIHWDPEVLRELGLGERPINQGPINVGYLAELAARTAGGVDRVRRLRVRFVGNVLAGDQVVCEGSVSSVDRDRMTAELELRAAVGERAVLSGTATIALR